MPPRRGGDAGAGAGAAISGGRGYFEPPPLKRMYPWQQDGAGQCDILAGGVDESGIFKGIHISGVHLVALLRTFQLSKVFMPVDTETPIAALGQSLQDGIPLVVVTRGCFGRELDCGPGPIRNELQKTIWDICRQMRADMPQVLISCIDLPINGSSDVVQACLEEPLNAYRELMYHEGTWYTPTVVNAASLGKWRADRKRDKLGKFGGDTFNRKQFAWIDEVSFYKDMFAVSWKDVLEVKKYPEPPRRSDLVFTGAKVEAQPIQDTSRSGAEVTFRKLLLKNRMSGDAKEMLASIKAYLDRSQLSEKNGLDDAVRACEEVAELFDRKGEALEACKARGVAVGTLIWMNELERALEMAKGMKNSATDPKLIVKAARLVQDCHLASGNLEMALEEAKSTNDGLKKAGDPESLCESFGLVVATELAKGDFNAGIASAKDASSSKDKVSSANGWLLVAEANMAKAASEQDVAERDACLREGITAQGKARQIYKELGKIDNEAEALLAAAKCSLTAGDSAGALALATELKALVSDADKANERDMIIMFAFGSQLLASAHLQHHEIEGSFMEGAADSALEAARQAVNLFEQIGDARRRAAAQRVLLSVRRAAFPCVQ